MTSDLPCPWRAHSRFKVFAMRTETPDSHQPELHRGGGLHRFADFVLSHRKRVIAFWVVLFLVSIPFAGQVQDRMSLDFALPGQPGYETTKKIVEKYKNGENEPSLLVVNLPAGQTVESNRD